MSDEEDYMSDKFLQGCEKSTKTPSLLYRHADKRNFAIMKKKIESKETSKEAMKIREDEQREEGLASAITSTNKGFTMLMKMGYKPGQGIGKTESGRVEPIPVELKSDRQGLGKPTKTLKRKPETQLNASELKSFRSRIAQKRTEHILKSDLYKSQKICEQLDLQAKVEKPQEEWFWPPKEEKTENESDEDNDPIENEENDNVPNTNEEQLEILTTYLRATYFYCIWCAVAYNDTQDLEENCPGDTRDDH